MHSRDGTERRHTTLANIPLHRPLSGHFPGGEFVRNSDARRDFRKDLNLSSETGSFTIGRGWPKRATSSSISEATRPSSTSPHESTSSIGQADKERAAAADQGTGNVLTTSRRRITGTGAGIRRSSP